MPGTRILLTLVVLSLVLSACIFGHGDPVPSEFRPKGVLVIVSGVGDGPGVSIDDAVSRGGSDPVLVNGALIVEEADGPVRLCDAIVLADRPYCRGSWVEVRGLDVTTVADLQNADGVRWSESVQLLGRLETD